MGKTSFALTSLVAAIPGGFLCYLLVMAFVSHAANLQLMSQIVVGLTLLCAASVALMPLGIFIFQGRASSASKSGSGRGKKSAVIDDDDDLDVVEASDDEVDSVDDLDETSSFEPVVDGDDDFTDSFEQDSKEMFLESSEDIEAVSDEILDVFDEDEEDEQPKKKKKK